MSKLFESIYNISQPLYSYKSSFTNPKTTIVYTDCDIPDSLRFHDYNIVQNGESVTVETTVSDVFLLVNESSLLHDVTVNDIAKRLSVTKPDSLSGLSTDKKFDSIVSRYIQSTPDVVKYSELINSEIEETDRKYKTWIDKNKLKLKEKDKDNNSN